MQQKPLTLQPVFGINAAKQKCFKQFEFMVLLVQEYRKHLHEYCLQCITLHFFP